MGKDKTVIYVHLCDISGILKSDTHGRLNSYVNTMKRIHIWHVARLSMLLYVLCEDTEIVRSGGQAVTLAGSGSLVRWAIGCHRRHAPATSSARSVSITEQDADCRCSQLFISLSRLQFVVF